MIAIDSVSFTYAQGGTKALDGVSLNIEAGDFFGIIGPSGAGKSTLVCAINGAIPHCFSGDFYGSVTVDGLDTFEVSLTDISTRVATVFQDIDASMVATVVEDELLFGLENFGVTHDEIETRIADVLESMDIADLRHAEIACLSGGQKQKVALASVLALRPKVLVLDEPTGALDPATSERVFDLLARLNRDFDITVVVVEQKIGLLAGYANHLAVIDEGRVKVQGDTRDVLGNAELLKQVGVNVPRVADLSLALHDRGAGDGRMCVDVAEATSLVEGLIA